MSTNQTFGATTVSKQPAAADTWEDFSFYINFAQKANTVGTTSLSDSEAADYARFDLRVYTNDAATESVQSCKATISISDVVIEPYIAEEGQLLPSSPSD